MTSICVQIIPVKKQSKANTIDEKYTEYIYCKYTYCIMVVYMSHILVYTLYVQYVLHVR